MHAMPMTGFSRALAPSAAAPDRTGLGKTPEVALGFWVVKIAATTLGETGGDAVSMSAHLGYLLGTGVFALAFVVLVGAQIAARSFRPFLYWAVIVATTTTGTTMADFADRSLGVGYPGGTAILALLLAATLASWRWSAGSVSVQAITRPKVEAFYWAAILFSNTLGTALGDWVADSGPGYEGGALIFAACIAAVAALYALTGVSRTLLFWAAFILTRPLGATVGDLLTKPRDAGGLALDRFEASAILAAFIVLCLLLLPQRASRGPEAGGAGAGRGG